MKRLLIRPGAIGDCILSLPAMEAVRGDFTDVWVPTVVKPLVRFADRVEAIADTGLDLVGLMDSPALRRFAEFDEIVSWYGNARDDFRDAVRDFPFVFHPALPPPPGVPKIAVPAVPRTRIVVHPFSGSQRKNWPLERFVELARRLDAELAVNLDGTPRMTDLYELGCWLASAKVFVGNDSGVTHLASAVGTPVVALFGPTDPAMWRPRGERVSVIRRASMEEISIDDVVAALDGLIGRDAGCGQESVWIDRRAG